MGKLTDHEQAWAAAMRAANRGCAQSYDRLLHEVAAALRVVTAQDFARRGLGSGDVEDVVQECLIALHLKRHTWDEDRPFVPWVRAIAHHKMVDRMRARLRAREVALDGHVDTIAAPREPDRIPDGLIARYLGELPPGQRAVVTALALEGESVGTAARRLNMSAGAVRVAMHRGLAALAAKLGKTP
jgi:RNA polymerase sigma-70 factor (ECF subfamily)